MKFQNKNISASNDIALKLKILAKKKASVRPKYAVTAKKLIRKAKQIVVTAKKNEAEVVLKENENARRKLAVTAKEKESVRRKLAVIAKGKESVRRKLVVTAKKLAVVAEKLAVTAKEKESVRNKLVVTAKKLAVTAKEKESVRRKLVVTAEEKESVRNKLVVIAKQLAVTAKEKESVRSRLEVVAKRLALKAKQLVVTAKEKEDVRNKLAVTAKQLASTAKEKENTRLKLVMTTDKLVRVEKLAVLGRLAGIMGHEIRNPIWVIRNSIYFLNMKFKGSMDEKVKSHMNILQTEINICDKIIYDILEFARTKPSFFTEAEINIVVEAVLSKANIPEIINVKTDLGKNLPKLNIDRVQIEQVFSNIIYNAIEAMPKGGELSVTTLQTDTFVSIAFKDTGVGIAKENTGKIFEPLFSTKAKGLGLGLVACQNIVNAHHGKIGFESKEGQGTTFTIKLPIAGYDIEVDALKEELKYKI